jgi:2TM family of unknown function (DUF5676)
METLKLDPKKLGLAGAIVAGILWTFYSVAVLLLTLLAINLSGDFAYTDLTNYDWHPPLVKFILFLYIFCLGAMLTGKMTAEIYNFLIDRCEIKLR